MLAGYSTTYVIAHMCKDSPTSYSLILPIKSHEYVPRATLHMPLFHSPIQSVTLKVIGLHNNRCFCNNSFQRAAKKTVFQRCSSFPPSLSVDHMRNEVCPLKRETWHGNATALPEVHPHGPSPLTLWSSQLDGTVGHSRLLMRPRWHIRTTRGSVHLAQIQG